LDTKAVFNHHLEAFMAGDADECLRDYTDESVLISAEGVVKGREALHAAFSHFFSDMFKPGTYDMTTDALHIEGDVVFIAFHASCASVDVPMGSDTFVIRDGKIVAQTFAGTFVPK
jgi:ketosteroid isomerase-like protein